MKRSLLLLIVLAVTQNLAAQTTQRAAQQGKFLKGYVDEKDRLKIFLNSGNTLLHTFDLHEEEAEDALVALSNDGYGSAWRLEDVNFDGYDDVLFRTNSGNVQQFEAVYLYRPKTGKLLYHGTLSAMPCLAADPVNRQISSTCNHSSAAENWTETYEWQNGVLIKTAQEGTMPEDAGLKVYEYRKVRRNGKWVYIYKRLLN